MKILIFAGYFYPHKGGYENHIYEFSEMMSKRGHQITILTTNTNNSSDFERINKNFEIYRIPVWNALKGTYPIPKINRKFKDIFKTLKEKNFNLIITETRFFTTTYLGYKFAKKNKIPLIHVEHGSNHTITKNIIVALINRIVDHTIGKSIVRYSKINIGISKNACKFIEHLGSKSYIEIPNSINLTNIPKYNIKKDIKNIIYVGRLIYAKGIQDLISAFSKLSNSNLKLTIVGDGPYRRELEILVEKLNLLNKVNFTGEKNQKEVMNLLSNSDLFINPSYSEGLPTSVLEAGAIGIPVIATDVGGTNEIINKKTGYLIKEKNPKQLKDSIEFMMNNSKQKIIYAKNLNKLVKDKFNWGKNIITWEKLLTNIKN